MVGLTRVGGGLTRGGGRLTCGGCCLDAVVVVN